MHCPTLVHCPASQGRIWPVEANLRQHAPTLVETGPAPARTVIFAACSSLSRSRIASRSSLDPPGVHLHMYRACGLERRHARITFIPLSSPTLGWVCNVGLIQPSPVLQVQSHCGPGSMQGCHSGACHPVPFCAGLACNWNKIALTRCLSAPRQGGGSPCSGQGPARSGGHPPTKSVCCPSQ